MFIALLFARFGTIRVSTPVMISLFINCQQTQTENNRTKLEQDKKMKKKMFWLA